MNNEQRKAASRYSLELIMVGVMLSSDGDGARFRKLIDPSLLSLTVPRELAKSIQARDKDSAVDVMASMGVNPINDETVVDAMLRVFLTDRRVELERMLANVVEGLEDGNVA